VGVVDRAKITDGSRTQKGDAVVGIASSGLHSNGFTLVRTVLLERAGLPLDREVPELGRTLGDELLEPTRIYSAALQPVFARYDVRGAAHITQGGGPGNLGRIIPNHLSARVDASAWPRPPIFDLVQQMGDVADAEMVRVFNLGLGMVLVAPGDQAESIVSDLASAGQEAYVVGEIVRREGDEAVVMR
jgi:phosphoribosylformylglycinamidine cyclo-ligase